MAENPLGFSMKEEQVVHLWWPDQPPQSAAEKIPLDAAESSGIFFAFDYPSLPHYTNPEKKNMKVLLTRSEAEVLFWLSDRPGRSFLIAEIMEGTGLSSATVYNAVEKFRHLGVLGAPSITVLTGRFERSTRPWKGGRFVTFSPPGIELDLK
jgi:hypothetical protein